MKSISLLFYCLKKILLGMHFVYLTFFYHIFSAQSDLTNSALGKSLVCQVHSKDEAGISIILYDTSNSEEDININEKLVQIYRSNNGALKNGGGSSSSNATPSRRESPGPPPLECPSEMSRSEASSPIGEINMMPEKYKTSSLYLNKEPVLDRILPI